MDVRIIDVEHGIRFCEYPDCKTTASKKIVKEVSGQKSVKYYCTTHFKHIVPLGDMKDP